MHSYLQVPIQLFHLRTALDPLYILLLQVPTNNLTIRFQRRPKILIVLFHLAQIRQRLQKLILPLNTSHQQPKQFPCQWSL